MALEGKFNERSRDIQLQFQYLYHASEAACELDLIMDNEGHSLSREVQLRMWQAFSKHTHLYVRAGGAFLPKHHLLMHMIHRVAVHGNPSGYSTYRDESLNGVLAKIARSCHRTAFGFGCHWKFQLLSGIVGGNRAAHLHP